LRLVATVDGETVQVEVRGRDGKYSVDLGGRRLEVDYLSPGGGFASLLIEGRSHDVGVERRPTGYAVHFPTDTVLVELADAVSVSPDLPKKAQTGPARITAPMPGKLIRVLVSRGDRVAHGQGLVVVEAMKMESEIRAPRAGQVSQLVVQEGQAVEAGALLAVVE